MGHRSGGSRSSSLEALCVKTREPSTLTPPVFINQMLLLQQLGYFSAVRRNGEAGAMWMVSRLCR